MCQAGRFAIEPQPEAPPEFCYDGSQCRHAEFLGQLVTFLEQDGGLLLIAASADVQQRLRVRVHRPRHLRAVTTSPAELERLLEVIDGAGCLARAVSERTKKTV